MNIAKKGIRQSLLLVGIVFVTHALQASQSLTLTKRQMCDLELIMNGGFAPLKGFMNQADYNGVVQNMRLADGTVWPMPIVLDVAEDIIKKAADDKTLLLKSSEGDVLATMQIENAWQPDKDNEAKMVYGTKDMLHPGVNYLINQTKSFYVSGSLTKVTEPQYYDFKKMRRTPEQLKQYFKEHGITKVVAFQTRNPMHRAHLELTFRAAKQVGAHLLIHPVVGQTKPGDVEYVPRVRCYDALLPHYPSGTATLSLLPLAMRMAGPREALWHAIIRKNYGCTHFIVGRDHAGPGNDSKGVPFYGPYDSQTLVKQYAHEVGIEPVFFSEMVYIPATDSYSPVDQIPAGTKTMSISGTELRNILNNGKEIPAWFTYPEVAKELRVAYPARNKQGFTVFFTGLSGAGKSTIANALALKLMEIQNRSITMLDGDEVRKTLCAGLGFSKEDRSRNVQRVGFVANEITKSGGIALCPLIAPYKDDRNHNRKLISANGGYVEVFVATSLDECEKRDTKGLYAQARAGKITQFTGISDPYEAPTSAELVIDTARVSVDQALDIIVGHLRNEGFVN